MRITTFIRFSCHSLIISLFLLLHPAIYAQTTTGSHIVEVDLKTGKNAATQNQSKFQQAINRAVSGSIIVLPKGQFYIAGTVDLSNSDVEKEGLVIEGQGGQGGVYTKEVGTVLMQTQKQKPIFQLTRRKREQPQFERTVIRDISFFDESSQEKRDKSNYDDGSFSAIRIENHVYWIIERCGFYNWPVGVWTYEGDELPGDNNGDTDNSWGLITSCRFSDNDWGIYSRSTAGFRVTFTDIQNANVGAMYLKGQHCMVSNCMLDAGTTDGKKNKKKIIGIHTVGTGHHITNTKLEGFAFPWLVSSKGSNAYIDGNGNKMSNCNIVGNGGSARGNIKINKETIFTEIRSVTYVNINVPELKQGWERVPKNIDKPKERDYAIWDEGKKTKLDIADDRVFLWDPSTNRIKSSERVEDSVLTDASSVSVYPNPVTDNTMSWTWDQAGIAGVQTEVLITDLSGKQVYREVSSEENVNIDTIFLYDLQAGIYFLSLKSGEHISNTRFVKQ